VSARRLAPLAVGAALLLGGCASNEPEDSVELNLPTQAEADAAASQRIQKQNADAEMQKLEQEIGAEKQP
jgi:uncharacterized lipoprotein YmbA